MKSAVFYGNMFIGEVEVYPQNSKTFNGIGETRIAYLSSASERCQPLAVLHTVSSGGVWVKVKPVGDESGLLAIHAACIRENKTAVVPMGEEELHLVAMTSRKNPSSNALFWGFRVRPGLYESSLSMLNLRCLNIVFDLDETLVVANTMRSFEDRIDALQKKVGNESDPQRAAGMLAEIKRYQDDKSTLKQYAESDQVVENGKAFKVQPEIVPPLSGNHQLITRPVVRLQERNIILTRVNPLIRDTSVLVRLRPAWEELRSYLTAKGRKRFEVYVCTMAERDYALEMWRLLDPDFSLISSSTLLDRIVCVKSGSKKSLLNVFQGGICHPKMALVIDDRLKVWDEKDQPRVHVVPAFAPYYAPQAEANSNIPILCVARNVACNVRGGFFKDFDDGILPQISEVFYEDVPEALPAAPDVGNYLVTEDDALTSIVNKNQTSLEVKVDADAERRIMSAGGPVQVVQSVITNLRPGPVTSLQHLVASSSGVPMQTASALAVSLPDKQCSQPVSLFKPLGQLTYHEPNHHVPVSEEGEVQDSEIDPDTRRRLLILQHGQDMRDPAPPIPVRPPVPAPVAPVQTPGNWFEEDYNLRKPMVSKEFNLEPETTFFDKKRSHHQPIFRNTDDHIHSERGFHKNWRLPMQSNYGVDSARQNHIAEKYTSAQGGEMPMIQNSVSYKNPQIETAKGYSQQAESQEILQQIAMKCGAKVEYHSSLCDSAELQFLIEVWFIGDKIGQGVGRTRGEAQHRAAEIALQYLAEKYLSNSQTGSDHSHGQFFKLSQAKQNGFMSLPVASTSEDSRYMDRQSASITALKELCTVEGFNLEFHPQSSPSTGSAGKGEVLAQVEVAGQIVGKGFAATWEDAKIQAAEEALRTLRSMLGQFTQKHASSPRSLSAIPAKRLKPDYSWPVQRTQPSDRYSKSEALVP